LAHAHTPRIVFHCPTLQLLCKKGSASNLGTAVVETLEMLEKTGGPKAFAAIK
jgi:hypothetical protein